MTWVTTDSGELVNLDNITSISIEKPLDANEDEDKKEKDKKDQDKSPTFILYASGHSGTHAFIELAVCESEMEADQLRLMLRACLVGKVGHIDLSDRKERHDREQRKKQEELPALPEPSPESSPASLNGVGHA